MTEPDHHQEEIDAAAALWVARLEGDPLSDAERRDLDRWLDASPRHVAAYEEARSAWALMGRVRVASGPLVRGLASMPVATMVGAAAPPHRTWLRAAALAAVVLLAIGGVRLWFGDPLVMLAADHMTAPGEVRSLELADGSAVELGPDSAIAVRFTSLERRVELLSGLAYFKPSPQRGGEARPFVVEAANGTVRALGTQFTVDRLPGAVEVVVVEHAVQVAVGASFERQAEAIVAAGEAVRYAEQGLGTVRALDADMSAAWRRGRLIFDHAPLGDVVVALNRYRRGRIVIANDALASRKVSGVFDAAAADTVLATIARELGVRTVALTPLVTLLY